MNEAQFKAEVLKAIEATLKQGEQSIEESGKTCLYRGENGLKCLVGHMIPDEAYREDFESYTAGTIEIRAALGVTDEQGEILEILQQCHDKMGNLPRGKAFQDAFVHNVKIYQKALPEWVVDGLVDILNRI